jgi:hypothetical protein
MSGRIFESVAWRDRAGGLTWIAHQKGPEKVNMERVIIPCPDGPYFSCRKSISEITPYGNKSGN